MQFCPKCDNIMDIGKSAPRTTLVQSTPDSVSTETNSNENQISKLIQLYKNKQDISNISVDIKELTSNTEFNKLKETDKNIILKILKGNEIDDSLTAYRICKNCSYFERLVGKTLVLSRMNIGSNLSSTQDLSKYKYMIHDKTLPHTRDYICKNDKCISHKDYSKRDAVWFRPSATSYATCYACTACNMVWNIS
jgi:DNA-directed RNA polymerase subunit M/transcription elongation factor TFIIS